MILDSIQTLCDLYHSNTWTQLGARTLLFGSSVDFFACAGSPFEDFQAISGSARAEFSTVLAMPDSTTEMTVIVDTLAEARSLRKHCSTHGIQHGMREAGASASFQDNSV